VLAVATWCFLRDEHAFLAEAARVLTPDGALLLGLLDWEAPPARAYLTAREDDPIYRHARPSSARRVDATLAHAGWCRRRWTQTLPHGPDAPAGPPRPGFGQGLFAAVLARR